MLRFFNFLKIKKKRNVFFLFFKKVLFGCASLAARERARKRAHATQQTPSQTAAREAQKPPPRLSPDSCFEKKTEREEKKISFLVFFFFVCSTLSMACTGMAHEGLLPCAICVQRFGNKMILQLIPLIARCCVLQRNRKPSHPSRHVVGAVLNKKSSGKKMFF